MAEDPAEKGGRPVPAPAPAADRLRQPPGGAAAAARSANHTERLTDRFARPADLAGRSTDHPAVLADHVERASPEWRRLYEAVSAALRRDRAGPGD
jgi:hypothetical protein